MVPEPYDAKAFALEPGSSLAIGLFRMLAAVQLDHQPKLVTVKIDDEAAERNLSAKLEVVKAAVA